ncbi:WD40 repeat-like protein [Favolaschia claudopus]|uniref:WD40 repeat-like protein n=1 Tax=Favolaschia claudopus TaxID=2862362 RepID=A0AAV9Z669_9AGAR
MALTLFVHSASDLIWKPSWRDFGKSPSLYVTVHDRKDHVFKTRVVKANFEPTWNESFDLTWPPPSMLTFRLFHDAPGLDVRIAEAEISVGALEQSSLNEDVWIDMKAPMDEVLGRLCVSLRAITGDKAVEQMSEQASRFELRPPVGVTLDPVATVEGLSSGAKLSDALSGVLSALENIVKVGDELAKIHPYANAAWKVLTSVYKIVQNQREADEKVVKLVDAMTKLYSFAKEVDFVVKNSKAVEETVLRIIMQTMECALLIREYLGHGFMATVELGRIAQTSILGAGQRIDQLAAELLRLKDEFDRGLAVQTSVVSAQILDTVEKLKNSLLLSDLRLPTHPSGLGPSTRRECLPGTRSEIIEHITHLLTTPSEAQIVWLSGVAGSGKTTIATSVSEYFRGLGRLGTFLCFTRNDLDGSDPILVLHTIAYGLAKAHPNIEQAICQALSRNLLEAPLDKQFQELLFRPLESVKHHLIGPFIIVIDGLDESAHWLDSLGNLIANFFTKLPAAFRFFVTSRPHFEVAKVFRHTAAVQERSLDITTEDRNDISLYIRDRLTTIRQHHGLSHTWPEEQIVRQLVDLSGNLFIWAATALDFVGGRNSFQPRKRLQKLLETPFRAATNLAQLYSLALQCAGNWNDSNFKETATAVLTAIALAKVPMTDSTIDAILGLDAGTAADVLEHLGSVVHWSTGQRAQTLHASFGDFLMGPYCANNPWSFTVAKAAKTLALACFAVMQKHLRFNICQLPDSHLLNSEVPGLLETMESHVSPVLMYATRFWGAHLGDFELDDEILVFLRSFLSDKFLFWLEVLSVRQEMASAAGILRLAQKYTLGKGNWSELFLADAQKFVSVFAPAITASAPHIYISAIPLAPRQSTVRAQYLSWFPRLLRYTVPESWASLEKALQGHDNLVTAVAFSPDSQRIVSGSYDNTVRLWDAATGAAIGEPLQGGGPVMSVAFSPDSQHIVSGSGDKTVRIWEAATGTAIGEPLQGHINWVTSVAFSPDSQHIVSGSYDNTVRIWDAATGAAIGAPLQGHNDWVTSVVFSPDSQHIVSGSYDNTVRIWDAATGAAIGEPLQGGGPVMSVAFSPDSQRIVSGSYDNTVRIWDAATGAAIGQPLQGHDDWVTSVAFSPVSQRIVSGSNDRSVRIWDAATGAAMGKPLQGGGPVKSVAFSPDSQHIVSGSRDSTVRIWDAATGAVFAEPLGEPLQGHDDWVMSVAFSPDGQRIVSGSSDKTVRIWDAATGAAIWGPLQGHDDWVMSVAFSPDSQRIVSGSGDKTVRIWGAATGTAIGEPLQGHDEPVTSVAFSPDSQRIVSGSGDKTVRIWDAATGAAIGEPLQASTTEHVPGPFVFAHRQTQTLTSSLLPPIPRGSFRDGWIFSTSSRLMWIPPMLRDSFCMPWCHLVISWRGVKSLDLSSFVHGAEWEKCIEQRYRNMQQ